MQEWWSSHLRGNWDDRERNLQCVLYHCHFCFLLLQVHLSFWCPDQCFWLIHLSQKWIDPFHVISHWLTGLDCYWEFLYMFYCCGYGNRDHCHVPHSTPEVSSRNWQSPGASYWRNSHCNAHSFICDDGNWVPSLVSAGWYECSDAIILSNVF